ncbi:MAG: hypothetical protein M3083_09550 [Actinomycetota bacterium]|nr:hypothetical protein [Actinomycetota bacterium]
MSMLGWLIVVVVLIAIGAATFVVLRLRSRTGRVIATRKSATPKIPKTPKTPKSMP